MSNRMKEDERIERIIRNLLKLPENRRCINCNSLGPQYVCTTFWTFVCTNCSGVHREFTHRVKSVSMAKFNAEEVSALQAGGNERARQIYFKEWDPQRHSFPDGSNQNRLRDFIKHAYVDRKFTGEWSTGKLAMVKSGAKEDSSERRSIERPSPRGMNDDRNSKYYIEERRNPRPKQDNGKYSSHRNRPIHFEVVDDRFREDGFGSGRQSEIQFGSGRRSEIHRPSNEEFREESRSPISQKRREKTSPPVLRPVSDILGENAPRLQVGESPRANDRRDNESSGPGQKTASSSDPSSDDVKPVAPKRVNSVSLIDFSADPNPPDTAAALQTQQTALSTESGNGAPDTLNVNSLESILFGLSAPADGPGDIMSEAPSNSDAHSAALAVLSSTATASTTNTPEAPSTGEASAASPVGMAPIQPCSSNDSNFRVANGQQLPFSQQNQFISSPGGYNSSTNQQTVPSVGALDNQSWTSSLVPYAQGSSSVSTEESSQPSSKVAQDTNSVVGSQALPGEPKSCARNELPADLFTSSYSSFPAPVPSWQIHPPHGMGFSMQNPPVSVPLPALTNSAKSRNPFDLNDDTTETQIPMFPSMLPVQAALPNSSAPTALLPTSNAHASQLIQPQALPYASIAPSQLPSYGMPLSSVAAAFNVQQLPYNMPLYRPQTIQPIRRDEDAFSSLNPIQQPRSRYPAPSTTNSSSSTGGNPFG